MWWSNVTGLTVMFIDQILSRRYQCFELNLASFSLSTTAFSFTITTKLWSFDENNFFFCVNWLFQNINKHLTHNQIKCDRRLKKIGLLEIKNRTKRRNRVKKGDDGMWCLRVKINRCDWSYVSSKTESLKISYVSSIRYLNITDILRARQIWRSSIKIYISLKIMNTAHISP